MNRGRRAIQNFSLSPEFSPSSGATGDLRIDRSLNLSKNELQRGARHFQDWHWGEPATRVIDANDPDLPKVLIACGTLIRLHVRPVQHRKQHPRRHVDHSIEFSRQLSAHSWVAYDPNHPSQRLYFIVHPQARRAFVQKLWTENTAAAVPLNTLASLVGGTHGRLQGYPNIQAKPLGLLTAVVYHTTKKGDGPSFYIHNIGEVSNVFPVLCVDATGRLWTVGGNTTAPTPGITD